MFRSAVGICDIIDAVCVIELTKGDAESLGMDRSDWHWSGLIGNRFQLAFQFDCEDWAGPSTTATFIAPVFAMIFGFFILKEPISIRMILGSVIILLGTGLTTGLIQFSPATILPKKPHQRRVEREVEEEEAKSFVVGSGVKNVQEQEF